MAEPSVNTSLEVIGPVVWGRPEHYCPEIAEEICQRLVEGATLTSICKDEEMPAIRTVYKWIDRHPDFGQNYAAARARQAHTQADEIEDVARDKTILPERARVIVDALKWKAARQNWRYFGDKVQIDVKETAADLPDTEVPGAIGFLARERLERSKGDE